MAQLWTIIFVALLAVGFSAAHWSDCKDAKRRQRRSDAHRERCGSRGDDQG